MQLSVLYFILQFYLDTYSPSHYPTSPPYEFHYHPFVFLYNVTTCVLIPKCSLFLPVLDCHGSHGGGGFPFFLNHIKSKLHSPLTHVTSSLVSVMYGFRPLDLVIQEPNQGDQGRGGGGLSLPAYWDGL